MTDIFVHTDVVWTNRMSHVQSLLQDLCSISLSGLLYWAPKNQQLDTSVKREAFQVGAGWLHKHQEGRRVAALVIAGSKTSDVVGVQGGYGEGVLVSVKEVFPNHLATHEEKMVLCPGCVQPTRRIVDLDFRNCGAMERTLLEVAEPD